MNFPALADFNLVARHGGFGRASRVSGQPKATLSRRVAELEQSLGVRLIERGTRSLRLTDAGAALHARTEGLMSEIAEVAETIGTGVGRPRGRLRISAPVLFAHATLGRVAAAFVRDYPEVQLEITAEDRVIDPVEEGYDLVIRVNPAPDGRLVGRCFLRNEALVVAVPSMGRPAPSPGQGAPSLVRAVVRATAGPGAAGTPWRVQDAHGTYELLPDPVLRFSSLLMVRDAVLAGVGAAVLPRSMVADDLAAGRLACWGVAEGRQTTLWVLHTSRRLVSGKVRAFLDLLERTFPGVSMQSSPAGKP